MYIANLAFIFIGLLHIAGNKTILGVASTSLHNLNLVVGGPLSISRRQDQVDQPSVRVKKRSDFLTQNKLSIKRQSKNFLFRNKITKNKTSTFPEPKLVVLNRSSRNNNVRKMDTFRNNVAYQKTVSPGNKMHMKNYFDPKDILLKKNQSYLKKRVSASNSINESKLIKRTVYPKVWEQDFISAIVSNKPTLRRWDQQIVPVIDETLESPKNAITNFHSRNNLEKVSSEKKQKKIISRKLSTSVMKSCIENGQVVIAVGCGDEIIDHSNINPNSYVANLLRNTQSNRLNTEKWKNVGDGRKQQWGYNRNNNKMFTNHPVSKPSFHTDGFDGNFKNEVNTELALAADSKDKAVEYATSVETYQDLSSPIHSLSYKMLNELQDDPSFDELEYHSENQPKGWPIFKHGVERESNAAFHSTNTLHLEGDTHKDFHEYPQSPIDILGAYNPLASNALQNKNFNYHSTDSLPNAPAYGFNRMNDKLTDGFANGHKVSFTDHNIENKVLSSTGHDTNGVYMHAGMLPGSQMHGLSTENSGNARVWLNNHEPDHANYHNNFHNQLNYYNHNNVHDHDLDQTHNLDHNHDQTQQNIFQNFDSHHGYNENSGNTGRLGAGSEFDSQLGHTYNLGGSIVHAVGDPFAGLEYSFNSPILNHPSGRGDNGMLGAMIAAGGGATSGAVFGVGGPSSEKISEPMFEGNSAVSVKVADQSSGAPDNNKNSITPGKDPQSKDNNKIQAGEKGNNLGNGSPMGSNSGIKNNGDNNGKGDAAGIQGNINKVSEKTGNNQGKGNGGNENGGSLNSSGSNGNSNSGFDIKNEKSSNERETFKENQGGVNGVNNGNVNNVGANKPNSNSGSSGSGVKDGGNGSNGINTNNRKNGNDGGDSENKNQENNTGAGGNAGTNDIEAGNGKNGNTNGSGNKSGGNVSNGEGNGNSNGGGINEKNSNGLNGSGREPNSQEKSRADGGGGNLGNNGANNMGAGGNGKNGNTNGSGDKNGGNVSNGGGKGNSNNAGGVNDKSNSASNGGGETNNQDNSRAGGGSGNSGKFGANNMGAGGIGKDGNTNSSGNKNGGNVNNEGGNGNSNNGGGFNEKSASGPDGRGREANNQENSRTDGGVGNLGNVGSNNMGTGGNGKNGNTNGSGNKSVENINNEGGNGNSNNGGSFNEKSASGPDGRGREANNPENSRTDGGGGNLGNVGSNNMGTGGNGKNGNTNSSGDKSGGNIRNGGGNGNENSNNGGGFNGKDGNGRDGKENEVNNQENLRANGGSGNLGNVGANNMGAGGNGKDGNTNSFGDKSVGNVNNERVNGNSNNGGGFNEKSVSGSEERGRETHSQENSRMGGGGGNLGSIAANNIGAGGNGKDGSYGDKSGGNVSNGAKGNSNNANGLYEKNCNGPNGRDNEANTQENSRTSCVDGNSGNAGNNNMGVIGTGNNRNTDSFRDQSSGNGFYNVGNGLAKNADRINGYDNDPEGRGSEANNEKNFRTSGNSGKIGANNMGAGVNENDRNTNTGSLVIGNGSGNGINGGEINGKNGNCPDGSLSGANSQKNSKLGGDSGSSGNAANNMGAGGNGNNGNADGFFNKNGGIALDGGPNDNSNNGDTNCLNERVIGLNSQEGLKTGEGGRSSVNVGNYMVAHRETGMNGKYNGNNGAGINGKNDNGSDRRESAEESQNIMKGAGSYNEIKNMEKNNMGESKFYGNRGGSESNSGKDTGGCTHECNNKFNTGVNGKSSLTNGSGDIRDGNIFINNRGSGFFSESAGNAGSNGILPDERRRNENVQEKFINAISFKDNYEARDIGTESSNINVDNNKSGDRERVDNNNIGTNSLFNRFGFSSDNRMKSFYDGVGADKNAFITNGEKIFKGKIVGNDHISNEYGLTNARVSVGVNGAGGADKSRLFKFKNFNQNTNSNQNQNIKSNENILCDTQSSVIRDNTINRGCGTPNGNINFDLTESFVNRAFEDGQRVTGSKNDLAAVLGVNFHNNNQDINADHENNKDFTKLNVNSFDALRGSTIVAEPTHRGNNILFTEQNSEIFSNTINGRSHESSSREGVSCLKGIGCNIVSGVNELGLNNPKHVNKTIHSSDNQMESILVQSSSAVVPSKVNGFKIGSRANGDSRDHSDGDVDRSNKVEIDKIENYEETKNGANSRVQTGSNENVNMGFGNDRCSCNKDTSLVSMDTYCSCNKIPTDSQNPGGNLTHQFVKFFENIAGKLHVNELVAVEEIVENIKNSHKSQTKTNLHEANIRVSSPVVKDKLPIPQEKLNNYFSPAIKTIVET